MVVPANRGIPVYSQMQCLPNVSDGTAPSYISYRHACITTQQIGCWHQLRERDLNPRETAYETVLEPNSSPSRNISTTAVFHNLNPAAPFAFHYELLTNRAVAIFFFGSRIPNVDCVFHFPTMITPPDKPASNLVEPTHRKSFSRKVSRVSPLSSLRGAFLRIG